MLVAGEHHAGVLAAGPVMDIAFNIGRTEDMAGALQADADADADALVRAVEQCEPVLVGQRNYALLDQFQVVLDHLGLATDTELEGVFEHERQQSRRGLAAQNQAL